MFFLHNIVVFDNFQAYDDGNFRAHTEAENRSESDEDSDETTENEDSDAIQEVDEDLDAEELEEQKREKDEQAKRLNKSERFSNWLEAATSQLDDLVVEVDGDCPLLVHPNEVDRLDELKR